MAYITGNESYDSRKETKQKSITGPLLFIKDNDKNVVRSAELFFWDDNVYNDPDRIGYFVTLSRVSPGSIRIAGKNDPVIGLVSGIADNRAARDANGEDMYVVNKFNQYILEETVYPITEIVELETGEFEEEIEYEDEEDENGNIISREKIVKKPIYKQVEVDTGRVKREFAKIENPKFNFDSYFEKPSTSTVIVVMRDDGTCVVGDYCTNGRGGIATHAQPSSLYKFKVVDRIDENTIKIIYE